MSIEKIIKPNILIEHLKRHFIRVRVDNYITVIYEYTLDNILIAL